MGQGEKQWLFGVRMRDLVGDKTDSLGSCHSVRFIHAT